MNTQNTDSAERPIGYWLKAVDRLMAAEFAAAFENEGITRRGWRLLNVIDGTVPADRPLPAHKLGRLIDRGWVTRSDEDWALTDDGRAARERLSGVVDGIRRKITDAVAPEDYDTTIATLQQIATAYGWEDGIELPRGPRRGQRRSSRHSGHGHLHGFGPRHGFGPHEHCPHQGVDAEHEHHGHRGGHGHGGYGRRYFGHGEFPHDRSTRGDGFAPQHDPRGSHPHHGRGHGHGRARAARAAQHAYERGFDAGFDRGAQTR